MLSLSTQIHWREMRTTLVVAPLVLAALAFAVISYMEWSSDVAVAEFMRTTELSASDPNHASDTSNPVQPHSGKTGCPQGKKPLPTQLMPLN